MELGARGRCITIFTDSQATLNALENCKTVSKLVWECKTALKDKVVQLVWVPGHCVIKRNELANRLAMLKAETCPIGTERYIGIALVLLRERSIIIE